MEGIDQQLNPATDILLSDSICSTKASIEQLSQILTDKQRRAVSYDEAEDIADSLLSFFSTLAETNTDQAATWQS